MHHLRRCSFDVTVVKGNTSLYWVLLYDKPPPRRLGWSQKRNQISCVDVGGCEVRVRKVYKGRFTSNNTNRKKMFGQMELTPRFHSPLIMLWAQVLQGAPYCSRLLGRQIITAL